MVVVHGHGALRHPLRAPAVALGNFDGVHRGHQVLFARTRRLADAHGGEAVAFTFDPHPARVLSPARAPRLITTLQRRLELIAATGMDACIVEPFDLSLAHLSPEEFVDRVLVEAIGAREVCVGYDFTFGRGRAGDTRRLAELGRARGFGVSVIDPVTVDGVVCSSTRVRQLVEAGSVEGAARLLGRDFEVDGEVVRGSGRGRSIGIPTANLRPETELLPHGGVYAGWALLPDRRRFAAAINVGTNPTFTAARRSDGLLSVEAHLLDFSDADLYGARIRLGFRVRLRDELRFPSVEALVEQIRKDVQAARQVAVHGRPISAISADGPTAASDTEAA